MQRNSVAICMVAQLCVLLAAMVFGAGQRLPGLRETILSGIIIGQSAFTALLAQWTGWPLVKRLLLLSGWLALLLASEAVNIWLDLRGAAGLRMQPYQPWLAHRGELVLLPAILSFLLIELLKLTGVQLRVDGRLATIRFRLFDVFILLTVVAVVCCTATSIARFTRPWMTLHSLPVSLVVAVAVACLAVITGWLASGKQKLLAACLLVTGVAAAHHWIIECVFAEYPMASDLPNVYLRMFYAALLYVATYTVSVRLFIGCLTPHGALQPDKP